MSRNKGGMLSVGFFTLLGLVSLGADGDAALTRTKVGEIMKLSPSGRKTPYPVQPTGERGKARDEKETDLLSSNPQDIPTGGSGESTCPEGWDKIHRGCYKFVTGGKTWNEALEFCKNSAGELTSVQSMREKEELQSHLLSNYPSFAKWWVGFQREGTRGTNWKWISNNNVDPSVTPWNNQRIKGRPGNMCGMIDMGRKKLEISVTSCAKNQPLICEFHQITPRPSTSTVDDSGVVNTGKTEGGDRASLADHGAKSKGTDSPVTSGGEKSSHINGDIGAMETVWTTDDLMTPTVMASTDRYSAAKFTSSKRPATVAQSGADTEDLNDPLTLTTREDHEFETTLPDEPDDLFTSLPTDKFYPTTPSESEDGLPGTGDIDEEDKKTDEEDSVGKGARATPATTIGTRRPKPVTRPAQSRPVTPRPTVVDWEAAYEAYEGCYIPVTGRSLKQTVLEAQRIYAAQRTSCPAIQFGAITWQETASGETARAKCAKGNGFATWECDSDNVCWLGQPDITGCVSKKLRSLLKLVEEPDVDEVRETMAPPTAEESVEVTSQLVEVTEEEETTMEDVLVMSQVMMAITEKKKNVPVKSKKQMKKIVQNVVTAGSNLVSSNKSAMWQEMTPEDKVRSASSLLVAMETATVSMADEIDEPVVITQKDENLELELRVVDVESLEKEDKTELVYGSEQAENSFTIPIETLKSVSKGRLAKAVFMTHYSMADLLGGKRKKSDSKESSPRLTDGGKTVVDQESTEESDEENDVEEMEPQIASYILSASLGGDGTLIKLPEPISFTMRHFLEANDDHIPLCSFWDVSHGDQLGFWSQRGCRVVRTNKTHTTCECDHMTNFAILMDVHGLKLTQTHNSALRLITIIGCVISITALLASWFTFQCFTSLQGERNSIHKNLAVCLIVAEIVFVTGIDQVQNKIACSVIAGFLHFFFLAAFTWMFIEGLHIIFMLVQVFDSSKSRLPYYYLTGYGVPGVVVGVSCLFYYQGYGTDKFCWLSSERYFIWAFAGPVVIILLVNALFLGYAMTTVCRHSDYVFNAKEKTTGSGIRAWIQGALALEVLLGLTWTLGYFFINDESLPLAYIFTILNSLQGLFIFVFHCLLNKKAKKEYRNVMRSVIVRSSSAGFTQSTYTKRSGHSNNSNHNSNHYHNHNSHEMNNHSPTNSHVKLHSSNSNSMA